MQLRNCILTIDETWQPILTEASGASTWLAVLRNYLGSEADGADFESFRLPVWASQIRSHESRQ